MGQCQDCITGDNINGRNSPTLAKNRIELKKLNSSVSDRRQRRRPGRHGAAGFANRDSLQREEAQLHVLHATRGNAENVFVSQSGDSKRDERGLGWPRTSRRRDGIRSRAKTTEWADSICARNPPASRPAAGAASCPARAGPGTATRRQSRSPEEPEPHRPPTPWPRAPEQRGIVYGDPENQINCAECRRGCRKTGEHSGTRLDGWAGPAACGAARARSCWP